MQNTDHADIRCYVTLLHIPLPMRARIRIADIAYGFFVGLQGGIVMKKWLLILSSVLLLLPGCSPLSSPTNSAISGAGSSAPEKAVYKKITAADAKAIIDGGGTFIILDVRTQEEFDAGYIAGAVLLPYDQISQKAASELPDKNATILVYCRSGNRSATASKALIELGYTCVLDFGGIIDWPYEIATP